ncbi:ABC transporter substrate-binding protein [Tropicimonas sp. IMCC34043]|uniref:ABC transporter substrate-binding protein n=1 Tax=Tropicimonas sp. IMCC34043 TaxID=2248760 RepID=UPI000E224E11|nr:ABC transporter substrate-binding protein [Tropicimonas sp. IMCC34043]
MRQLKYALIVAGAVSGVPYAVLATPSDDTLVVGLSADIDTLDPGEISSRDASNVAEHIFTTLSSISVDGQVTPRLADTYTVSDDGKSLTYHIPPGHTCQDGETLDAEDVAYSFNRAADPANKFTGNTPGFIFTSIDFKDAIAPDPEHVVINVGIKSSMTPGFLTEVFVHCKDSYEKMSLDDATTHPVASGPYQVVDWTPGSEIVLEKRQDPGNFKTIEYRIIPEASTRTAELLTGNVDIITNVSPDQIGAIDNSNVARVEKVQGTRRMYVGFNQSAMFDSPGAMAIKKADVRRALQYAVDVPTICQQLLSIECERATSLVNPPQGNPDLTPYPYDPAMAEKLLDEAGYPRDADGVRFEMTLQAPRGRYLNDANVALAVGQYLSDIGVATNVELMEWSSVYVPLIRKHEAGPMFFLGSGGGLWSALYDMSDLAAVDSGPNYTDWDDPRWFSRWADIEAAKSPEEERTIINEMLKVFHDDGPWLLMYFQPDFYGVSNRIDWTARRDEVVELFDAKLAAK